MADLHLEVDGEVVGDGALYDEDLNVRVVNDAAENGYTDEEDEETPLDWMNSAGIVLDRDTDSVHMRVSVGDPRGAFVFTVRRKPNGELIIHTPYPGEGFPHMDLEEHHQGTYLVK